MGAGGNCYRFNGIEHNEELGLDLAAFRSYDPAIGRWLQVDPLAELAPELNPYRMGFNNPISYVDPLGLFESRREARRFKRANGLRGRTKRTSKDKDGNKTFAFTDRDSGNEYTSGSVSAGNFSNDAAFPTAEITLNGETTKVRVPYSGTLQSSGSNLIGNLGRSLGRVRDHSFVTGLGYSFVDPFFVTIQSFNPLQTRSVYHLDGTFVGSSTEKTIAFGSAVTSAVPFIKASNSIQAVYPQGLIISKKLNAAQFSKAFKGTMISRAHPKVRGYLNRTLNFGLDKGNNTLSRGNAAATSLGLIKSVSPSQND